MPAEHPKLAIKAARVSLWEWNVDTDESTVRPDRNR
jgi:hypothetical protein